MKLHLTSAYSTHPGLDTLLDCVAKDSVNQHEHTNDPQKADAILFVENTQFDDMLFTQLNNHPYIRSYPKKVFMYNEMDRPWHNLPGLYCCMSSKHFDYSQHRAFAYLSSPNPYITEVVKHRDSISYLYSFMGSMSHACRRPILRLSNKEGYVEDTSDFNVWNTTHDELETRGKRYASVLAQSQFVLCPRGIGTSSIRLYETLEAGRVPVIIADQWVPPAETDWSFAIKVEQRRVSSIPGLLHSMRNEADERGLAARQAWEKSYAPNRLFNTVCNSIESLLSTGLDCRHQTGINFRKWVATGQLLSRTAAQKIKNYR